MNLKLTFFADPGHGWLRVPLKSLIALDLVDQITPFSYINLNKRAYCYLEEDCDCPTFLQALEAKGITPKISHRISNNESSIRTYWPFNQQTVGWARQYLIHE